MVIFLAYIDGNTAYILFLYSWPMGCFDSLAILDTGVN